MTSLVLGVPLLTNKHIPVATPKVTLNKNVSVSDSFRSEFNDWLRGFFGEEPVIYKMNMSALYGEVDPSILDPLGAQTEAFVTHPLNIVHIREAMEKINALT